MKAIKIKTEWILYPKLPSSWKNKTPYNPITEGFKDVITPTISDSQKLGKLVYNKDNDIVTYEVINLTDSEIKAKELDNAKTIDAIRFIAQLSYEGITSDAIMAVIETLPDEQKIYATASFNRATTFDRDNAFIGLIGQAFGKTSDELDDIFIKASKLP